MNNFDSAFTLVTGLENTFQKNHTVQSSKQRKSFCCEGSISLWKVDGKAALFGQGLSGKRAAYLHGIYGCTLGSFTPESPGICGHLPPAWQVTSKAATAVSTTDGWDSMAAQPSCKETHTFIRKWFWLNIIGHFFSFRRSSPPPPSPIAPSLRCSWSHLSH